LKHNKAKHSIVTFSFNFEKSLEDMTSEEEPPTKKRKNQDHQENEESRSNTTKFKSYILFKVIS
jgi:hypothetical protein